MHANKLLSLRSSQSQSADVHTSTPVQPHTPSNVASDEHILPYADGCNANLGAPLLVTGDRLAAARTSIKLVVV
jgi:hypothetical protein